jgi:hypothetical protein
MDKESLAFFSDPAFLELPERKKFRAVSEFLIREIDRAPHQSFLLGRIIDIITAINDLQVLREPYLFSHFEFWLNHFSDKTPEQIRLIRGKITGKYIPRESYQSFFPVGNGKYFSGSHFVIAHLSPDVDTTIASFLIWLEAFSAPVSKGLHYWNVPGSLPTSPVMSVMKQKLGEEIFDVVMKKKAIITLTAEDLLTQEGFIKSSGDTSISSLDHGLAEKAIILVDKEGRYIGDWRASDVEGVRQIIVLIKGALKSFENDFLIGLTRLLGQQTITEQDLNQFIQNTFNDPFGHKDLSIKENDWLDKWLKIVAQCPKGIETSFQSFFEQENIAALSNLKNETESVVLKVIRSINSIDRPALFKSIEKLITQLNEGMFVARESIEKLSSAIAIKMEVLGFFPHTLNLSSDIDEIRLKMKHYDYLTVVIKGDNGLFPVGIVRDKDVRISPLGTASFCDFSNFEEVKLPSYLSVISIIDHHKSDFKTDQPTFTLIADTQSCNVLVAENLFKINERYSLGPLTLEENEALLKSLPSTNENIGKIESLLKTKAAHERRGDSFIHPDREKLDYLLALYAILDDTDLLTKVTPRDVNVVRELINRLYSLERHELLDLVQFDEIPFDEHYASLAAEKILQLPEMYELYQHILTLMETETEELLAKAEKGQIDDLFKDTKEQNGLAQVGQIKMFAQNFQHFDKIESLIRQKWSEKCSQVHQSSPDIDLFIMMVSTIPAAVTVTEENHIHYDQLWFWIPPKGEGHLTAFLNAFQTAANDIDFELVLINDEGELKHLFEHNFKTVNKIETKKENISSKAAVLRFKPGAINSRKAMISPFLPRLN